METRKQVARTNWYIVQVSTGSEHKMCAELTRRCAEHDKQTKLEEAKVGLVECFSPKFASRKKRKGEWLDVERPLIPGYVVADAANPAALAHILSQTRSFCRLLAIDEQYAPLNERERAWIESQTSVDERVVPLSFGQKVGDTLVITDGPLAGNEALITKFDRKNCLAHIELHVGQMTLKTTVGLAIMPSGKVRQVIS